MPKGSEELTNSRKEEIINACGKLYETMSFKEITIKLIGGATSFTRTSIYNYFQTKEEIFLALLKREYEQWIADLKQAADSCTEMSPKQLAQTIAGSLAPRELMLKLLSMNHYDLEENVRIENLVDFKSAYGGSINAISGLLRKFCKGFSESDIDRFVYQFFPFLFGIYPYTCVTEKQKLAMERAGIDFARLSIYEITVACVEKLLSK